MSKVIETADLWTEKVNAKDVKGVLAVSDSNIEMVGPRGTAAGHETLTQWVEDSGLHLTTVTRFAKADTVVYEQQGTWENQDGQVTVYTVMEVENGKVTRVSRYDTLDEAFGTSGLSEEDRVE
ncbi:nuclear transport factor 2 family protein [Planococcus salinus]|uniref:Nuclear transport factor 2 family protein n=1 Tax=Planococcus salinus TaxID=1848460 RepID=A0A3M8P4U7_9BACL|nr:nuclear transport factor 2 family protein [Planococcus salinus]RNF38687.1 nuclear transport factor 2 family protein [Planococcus salinus]